MLIAKEKNTNGAIAARGRPGRQPAHMRSVLLHTGKYAAARQAGAQWGPAGLGAMLHVVTERHKRNGRRRPGCALLAEGSAGPQSKGSRAWAGVCRGGDPLPTFSVAAAPRTARGPSGSVLEWSRHQVLWEAIHGAWRGAAGASVAERRGPSWGPTPDATRQSEDLPTSHPASRLAPATVTPAPAQLPRRWAVCLPELSWDAEPTPGPGRDSTSGSAEPRPPFMAGRSRGGRGWQGAGVWGVGAASVSRRCPVNAGGDRNAAERAAGGAKQPGSGGGAGLEGAEHQAWAVRSVG